MPHVNEARSSFCNSGVTNVLFVLLRANFLEYIFI